MEKKVTPKNLQLILFMLFFCGLSFYAHSEDLTFYFKEEKNYFEFYIDNNTEQNIGLSAFKRGPVLLFLFFSEDGSLFPNRYWRLGDPISCCYKMHIEFLPKSKKLQLGYPPNPSRTFYKDFRRLKNRDYGMTNFDLDPNKTGKEFSDGRLYFICFLNKARDGKSPPYETGFYTMLMKNGVIVSIEKPPQESVPIAVLEAMKKEFDKIMSEEKSGKYGYP